MKKGKFTDLIQLTVICFYTFIIILFLSLPLFKRMSDSVKFSFYKMCANFNAAGIVLTILYFILILSALVMGFIQSLFIHKKKWFCFIKEILVIIMSGIFIYIMFSTSSLVRYDNYQVLSYGWCLTIGISFPLFLYICDYLEAILQAE